MKAKRLNLVASAIAAVSVLSMAYTANLGGQIRHTELRSGAPTAAAENEAEEGQKAVGAPEGKTEGQPGNKKDDDGDAD